MAAHVHTHPRCDLGYENRLHPVSSFDIIAVLDDRRAIFSETSCLVDQVNCCNGRPRRMSPAIILDDENGSTSASAAFSDFYVNKIKLTVHEMTVAHIKSKAYYYYYLLHHKVAHRE